MVHQYFTHSMTQFLLSYMMITVIQINTASIDLLSADNQFIAKYGYDAFIEEITRQHGVSPRSDEPVELPSHQQAILAEMLRSFKSNGSIQEPVSFSSGTQRNNQDPNRRAWNQRRQSILNELRKSAHYDLSTPINPNLDPRIGFNTPSPTNPPDWFSIKSDVGSFDIDMIPENENLVGVLIACIISVSLTVIGVIVSCVLIYQHRKRTGSWPLRDSTLTTTEFSDDGWSPYDTPIL